VQICFFCRWTAGLASHARLLVFVDMQTQLHSESASVAFLNRSATQHEQQTVKWNISCLPSSSETGAGGIASISFTASTACKATSALAQVNLLINNWPGKRMQQLVAAGSHLKEVHPAQTPLAVQTQKQRCLMEGYNNLGACESQTLCEALI